MSTKPEFATIEAQLDYHDERLLTAFDNDRSDQDKEGDPLFNELMEGDPNGIGQHQPGAKLDAGKIDVGLLFESFPHALMAIAEVATFGAAKYTRGGWKEVPGGVLRYKAAEGRHMLYRHMGEWFDKESGKTHIAHEGWNKLAQLEFFLSGREAQ